MLSHKKSQLSFLLSTPLLIVILILITILALILFGFSYFASKNAFVLMGMFLVVIGGVGFLMKFDIKIAISFVIVGVLLLIVPYLSSSASSVTLASILPK